MAQLTRAYASSQACTNLYTHTYTLPLQEHKLSKSVSISTHLC